MSASDIPVNTRPRPAEVNILDESASIAMGSDQVANKEAIDAVWNVCNGLDDNTLQLCRFYYLGELMTGFIRQLQVPRNRDQVVSSAGAILADTARNMTEHVDREQMSIPMSALLDPGINNPFIPFALAASSNLAPHVLHVLLAADTVNVAARNRQLEKGVARLQHRAPRSLRELPIPYAEILDGNSTATRIGKLALSSSLQLYEMYLYKRAAEIGSKGTPDSAAGDTHVYLEDVISEKELLQLEFVQVAMLSASVHLNEFTAVTHRVRSYMRINAKMQPEIPRGQFPKPVHREPTGHSYDIYASPPDMPRTDVLNDRRFGCPMKYVTGGIPFIMDLTKDVVISAEQQLHTNKTASAETIAGSTPPLRGIKELQFRLGTWLRHKLNKRPNR